MRKFFKPFMLLTLLITSVNAFSQTKDIVAPEEILTKAKEWTSALNLTDRTKKSAVENVIAVHLTTIRDWHNDHQTDHSRFCYAFNCSSSFNGWIEKKLNT
jgi:Na+-transporting methylmalonyl-CoA/oxaloacetate decarboxylase gamma subunit